MERAGFASSQDLQMAMWKIWSSHCQAKQHRQGERQATVALLDSLSTTTLLPLLRPSTTLHCEVCLNWLSYAHAHSKENEFQLEVTPSLPNLANLVQILGCHNSWISLMMGNAFEQQANLQSLLDLQPVLAGPRALTVQALHQIARQAEKMPKPMYLWMLLRSLSATQSCPRAIEGSELQSKAPACWECEGGCMPRRSRSHPRRQAAEWGQAQCQKPSKAEGLECN